MWQAIKKWLVESFREMEDAALWTVDFVEGRVGPLGDRDE